MDEIRIRLSSIDKVLPTKADRTDVDSLSEVCSSITYPRSSDIVFLVVQRFDRRQTAAPTKVLESPRTKRPARQPASPNSPGDSTDMSEIQGELSAIRSALNEMHTQLDSLEERKADRRDVMKLIADLKSVSSGYILLGRITHSFT